jgi:hypothetical protein
MVEGVADGAGDEGFDLREVGGLACGDFVHGRLTSL